MFIFKVKSSNRISVVICILGETGLERLRIRQENHVLPVLPAMEARAIKTSVMPHQDLEKMLSDTSKMHTKYSTFYCY